MQSVSQQTRLLFIIYANVKKTLKSCIKQKTLLPQNVQRLFTNRQGNYDLKGHSLFESEYVRTSMKSFLISELQGGIAYRTN